MRRKALRVIADKHNKDGWYDKLTTPDVSDLKISAMLAWEGYLTSLRCMQIVQGNVVVAAFPWVQMKKLASIVTYAVQIDNLYGQHLGHLGSILAGVKCTMLELNNMELSEADIRALVTAMRNRVDKVYLSGNITLDIEQITKYDGRGRCRYLNLRVWEDGRAWYGDRLRSWAAHVGWTVTLDDGIRLEMKRKGRTRPRHVRSRIRMALFYYSC